MTEWLLLVVLWLSAAVPQPTATPQQSAAIQTQDAKTFTITARRFTYNVTPLPFTVNQGDLVTLNITAADNGAGTGHGFRLRTYADSSHTMMPGDPPLVIQFTAHTAGQFQFFCTHFCGSGHSSMDGVFTVLGAAPMSISDIAPTSGPTNGGTTVTIHGDGFTNGATVKFGTVPAGSVQFISATELRAVTPLGPSDFANTKAVDLVVKNPDDATAQKTFTWTLPAPSIASVSPPSGTKSGGTLVTIVGAGFSTAAQPSVTFGGAAATNVTVVDAVTLTARTPGHATGTADVAISTSKGSTTSAGAYRFVGAKQRAMRH